MLNGIDLEEWDPAMDMALPANFNANQLEGKALCKRYLQRGLGLKEDPSKPLVAVISRLVPQKGVNLIQVGGARGVGVPGCCLPACLQRCMHAVVHWQARAVCGWMLLC